MLVYLKIPEFFWPNSHNFPIFRYTLIPKDHKKHSANHIARARAKRSAAERLLLLRCASTLERSAALRRRVRVVLEDQMSGEILLVAARRRRTRRTVQRTHRLVELVRQP